MNDVYREVDFKSYCPQCIYYDRDECLIPCCYCLEEVVNIESNKPTEFKEKEKEKGK